MPGLAGCCWRGNEGDAVKVCEEGGETVEDGTDREVRGEGRKRLGGGGCGVTVEVEVAVPGLEGGRRGKVEVGLFEGGEERHFGAGGWEIGRCEGGEELCYMGWGRERAKERRELARREGKVASSRRRVSRSFTRGDLVPAATTGLRSLLSPSQQV